MGGDYLSAAPEKDSARHREDLIYISICSGGAIIKISAAERPNFVLGQGAHLTRTPSRSIPRGTRRPRRFRTIQD
jgi:hypothetical protein